MKFFALLLLAACGPLPPPEVTEIRILDGEIWIHRSDNSWTLTLTEQPEDTDGTQE